MELLSHYQHIELILEERRQGSLYGAKLLLRRNDLDPTSFDSTSTCHTLTEFILFIPDDERDGTVKPAYDILLTKLGFLHNAIDEIRAMARAGRKDGKHNHLDSGTFFPIGDS